jgi:hypothetical protein
MLARAQRRANSRLTDLISPLTRRVLGAELNRPTERSVEAAGLHITEVRRNGIWREIVAAPHT